MTEACATIRVEHADLEEGVEINKSDYDADPKAYKLFKGKAKVVPAAGSAPGPQTAEADVNSAAGNHQVTGVGGWGEQAPAPPPVEPQTAADAAGS